MTSEWRHVPPISIGGITITKLGFFLFDLFYLVTWDDVGLYYVHKAQEMILTDVSDTIHADSLALFALNIEVLLADVTKPEISKHFDFDLTCDVTGDPEVIQICFPITVFQGFRMPLEFF